MPALTNSVSPNRQVMRLPDRRSFIHMIILLSLFGVALFGALAGYVIFCDRV